MQSRRQQYHLREIDPEIIKNMSITGIFDYRLITRFTSELSNYVADEVSKWQRGKDQSTNIEPDPFTNTEDFPVQDPVENNKASLQFFVCTFLTPLMFNMVMDQSEKRYSQAQFKRHFEIKTEIKFGLLASHR